MEGDTSRYSPYFYRKPIFLSFLNKEHYQLFNGVKGEYYSGQGHNDPDFPAATGIQLEENRMTGSSGETKNQRSFFNSCLMMYSVLSVTRTLK